MAEELVVLINLEDTNADLIRREVPQLEWKLEKKLKLLYTQDNMELRIHQIHRRVCEVKASEEMGVRYMQEWEEKVYIRQEGREEGREEGIQILLELCSEHQIPQNEIVEKMIQKFSITEEEAQEYLKKYWK